MKEKEQGALNRCLFLWKVNSFFYIRPECKKKIANALA